MHHTSAHFLCLFLSMATLSACGYMDHDLFVDDQTFEESMSTQSFSMGSMHISGCGGGIGLRISGIGISGSGSSRGHGIGRTSTSRTTRTTHHGPNTAMISPLVVRRGSATPTQEEEEAPALNSAQRRLMDHATQGQRYFAEQSKVNVQ